MKRKKKLSKRRVSFVGWVSTYGGRRGWFADAEGKPNFTAVYFSKRRASRGISPAVKVRVTEIR